MNLIEAISKLDARLLRDEQGHEIKGPYWVNRNDVIELLLAGLIPRCQERHPESGQCELRLGHDKIHLAGLYCWPVAPVEAEGK
jgi:hypothetical protein